MTTQKPRSPVMQELYDFVRNEPEWALPALLRFFKRIKAGQGNDASAKLWLDERAAAEEAHLRQ